MSEPPVLPVYVCPRCGATSDAQAETCWLCRDRQSNPYAAAPGLALSGAPAWTAHSRTETIFLFLLIACVVLTVPIGVGLAVQDPGTLIPFLIVVGPAYLVTAIRGIWEYNHRGRTQPGKLLLTLLLSGFLTVAAMAVLVVASIIALFLWCLAQFAR